MSIFIFLTLLLSGASDSTPTISLSSQKPAIYGKSLTLMCQSDQDVGLGYVVFRRDGSNIIRITDTCDKVEETPSDKLSSYSIMCNLPQRIFTMVKYNVSYSDHNTSWNCQMYSASGSNGSCVGNSNSCNSAPVKVTVEGPPFVQMKPAESDYNVIEKTANLTFTCIVTLAVPWPASNSFIWLFKGSVIQGQRSLSYTIPSVQRSNDGCYQCIATNPYGNGTSKKLKLDVQYAPIISLPNSEEIEEGDTLKVRCNVSANPKSVVVWTISGENVSLSNDLTIASIKRHQGGNYTCTAKNTLQPTGQSPVTKISTKMLEVNVLYGPVVNVTGNITINEGESLTVECSVDANPPAFHIYWSKNDDVAFYRNTTMLSFGRVSRHDSGTYGCTAQNKIRPSGRNDEKIITETMFFHLHVRFDETSVILPVVGGTLSVIVVLTFVVITVFIVKLRGRSSRHFKTQVAMSNHMENSGSLSGKCLEPIYANTTNTLNARREDYEDLLVSRPTSNIYSRLTVLSDNKAKERGNNNDRHSNVDVTDDIYLYSNYQGPTDVTQLQDIQSEGENQMYANLEARL